MTVTQDLLLGFLENCEVFVVCAQIEQEIAELEELIDAGLATEMNETK